MSDSLLNEMGWEALANIRLRRLEEVNEENARLQIERADMLTALKAALPHIDCSDECGHCDAIRLTRAAIAKADGKP